MNQITKIFVFLAFILVLTSCTKTELVNDTHSEDWNAIIDLMNAQCTALKHESIDELSALYAFAENTLEYAELRKTAHEKFKSVNLLDCIFDVTKMDFRRFGSEVEVHMNVTTTERVEGRAEETSVIVPNSNGNDFIFRKINGNWKFCPNSDCSGTTTQKYICETGELVDEKFQCPQIIAGDISITPLSQCFDNLSVEKILRSNIGPYKLQEKSVQLVEEDPTTKLSKYYQGDYMRSDDNRRLFNYAFVQAEDETSYLKIQTQFQSDINKISDSFPTTEVTKVPLRDSDAIRVQLTKGAKGDEFLFIRTRFYVAIPEQKAFMRFMFNDWVNIEDVEPIIRTYMNSLCESDVY